MALTRKLLKGMGLTEEQIDSVIDAHTETVDALKTQINNYKADAEKLPSVQKELDGYKNGTDWKAEHDKVKQDYDKVKQEFDNFKTEVAGKESLAAKQAAFRKLLAVENIPDKFHDRIVKMTDFDAVEMDGDAIRDEAKVRENIKTEWGEYAATVETKGDKPETPPSGKAQMTKAEILAIKDTAERQKAIADNLNLFR